MSGGDDQQHLREILGKPFVDMEQNLFFSLPGAPADKDRLERLEAQELLHACLNRGISLRGEKIVFCVAVDSHFLGVRPHVHDPMSIRFSDHAEGIDFFQDITEKRPNGEIPAERSRGNPAMDKGDRGASPVCLRDPRRPDLGFQKDHDLGLHR